jgi:hypothetical protein
VKTSFATVVDIPIELALNVVRDRRLLDGIDHLEYRFDTASLAISVPIEMEVDRPEIVTEPIAAAVIRFRGAAKDHRVLYPVLDSVLEITQTRPGSIEVALDTTYRPPGSAIGIVADALAMHRVADEAIGRLFDEIVGRLIDEAQLAVLMAGVPI